LSQWIVSRIYLSETEHHAFEIFEGREVRKNERVQTNEIRKNRYFYDAGDKAIEIDVFLGELWGLNLAKVCFESLEELRKFKPPPFSILEVTQDEFFVGQI
jgi:CYTH domain-containing protein